MAVNPNALAVLSKRYLLKDDAGNVIETPRQMFERVAREIARVERPYMSPFKLGQLERQYADMMEEGIFEPNSPLLANAGKPGMQYSACFPAGTTITLRDGYAPIETVKPGDLVLTHTGRYMPIERTMQRVDRLLRIKVDKLPDLFVTAEHPFLTERGWVKAGDLTAKQDFVQIARHLDRGLDGYTINVPGVEVDGWVYKPTSDKQQRSGAYNKQVRPIKANIPVDENVAWLLGMYVAEGSISSKADTLCDVRFVLSTDEAAFAERIQAILEDYFGLAAAVFTTERESAWITIRAHSTLFAQWLMAEFGKGFNGKRIPHWLHYLPETIRMAFLQGVADGDGTPVNGSQTRITLANEGAIHSLFDLAAGLYFYPNLSMAYMPAHASTQQWSMTYGPTYNIGMAHEGGYYRVVSVENTDITATVYNFEVAEDHTYVANHIVVHNCYVLPIEDDMRSIFTTMGDAAIIHKQGGGTGFAFSRLRPSGDYVLSTMGVASGPISFMEVYNAATGAIAQGGMRRGANMGVLRVDHPDVLSFITAKADTSKITNFNISVAATDEFMRAVKADGVYALRNPRTKAVYIAPKPILHPQTGEELVAAGEHAWLPARVVFNLIIDNAWATGEPGLLFIDEANRSNPVPHLGDYEATNPCGEQWLLPYDVCNLGSINLGAFVSNNSFFDWVALKGYIKLATRFLDAVIDANTYPLPQIDELAKGIRRIGLGVMGYADALIKMGIPYGSDKAISFAKEVMSFLQRNAEEESENLARIKGAFPEWERSVWGPDETCARDQNGDRIKPFKHLRNCNITTVAPTGTISMIAGCSSGIEPLFAIAFTRNQAGMLMTEVNADFEAAARAGGWYSEELMSRIAAAGHIHFAEVPQAIQDVYQTAHDISPAWHVATQAAFQAHCHSSISKTINFSNEATREDVAAAYMQAYEAGCKGITVYRDGSRFGQVLSTGATGSTTSPEAQSAPEAPDPVSQVPPAAEAAQNGAQEAPRYRPEPIRLPPNLPADSFRLQTPGGTLHAFVTLHEREPVELYTVIGRAGSDVQAFTEAMGRLVSLALRCGIDPNLIADQLEGIGGASPSVGFGANRVSSVPDGVGRILRMAADAAARERRRSPEEPLEVGGFFAEAAETLELNREPLTFPDRALIPVTAARFEEPKGKATGSLCPDCKNMTVYKADGCSKCISCGFSAC